jgi:hypothetical protein
VSCPDCRPRGMARFWLWLARFAFRRLQPGGKMPAGVPRVRDPEAPCTGFAPRKPKPGDYECRSDGHYLCAECAHLAPPEDPS